jgi:hypothetical protein
MMIGYHYGPSYIDTNEACSCTCAPPAVSSSSSFQWPAWRVDNGVFKTLSSQLLVANRWMRVERHTIRITSPPSPSASSTIIDDWLWVDEPPHVNMLVHEQSSDQYLVFYQSKYGLANHSYATAGIHTSLPLSFIAHLFTHYSL